MGRTPCSVGLFPLCVPVGKPHSAVTVGEGGAGSGWGELSGDDQMFTGRQCPPLKAHLFSDIITNPLSIQHNFYVQKRSFDIWVDCVILSYSQVCGRQTCGSWTNRGPWWLKDSPCYSEQGRSHLGCAHMLFFPPDFRYYLKLAPYSSTVSAYRRNIYQQICKSVLISGCIIKHKISLNYQMPLVRSVCQAIFVH